MYIIKNIVSSSTILLLLFSCSGNTSIADTQFDVSVDQPMLSGLRPTVYFDESHNNHHRVSTTYKPFAALLAKDGCIVNSNKKPISQPVLSDARIYIIATAKGKEDPGATSPFTQEEIDVLEAWVHDGGSALIITEHYPFGAAMTPLLNKFGVEIHNGYTEDTSLITQEVRDALRFEKSKGQLNATHPLLHGIERINTFTGSSVKGDSTWIPLLIFTPNAQNFNVSVEMKKEGGDITTSIAYSDFYPALGYAQGLSKEYGKGRIVVFAESAFLTAQIDNNGNKFGMNIPDTDNKQFVLNVIRWLAL
jgi:hypothetical protein